MKQLTIVEFEQSDFDPAIKLCQRLGYGCSYAYTSTSDIPGMYLIPTYPGQPELILCKTLEHGMLVIRTLE